MDILPHQDFQIISGKKPYKHMMKMHGIMFKVLGNTNRFAIRSMNVFGMCLTMDFGKEEVLEMQ